MLSNLYVTAVTQDIKFTPTPLETGQKFKL